MKLVIELPEAFREHFNMDKFKDSLGRICTDLDEIQARRDERFHDPLPFMSGNYEKELMDALEKALPNSVDLEMLTKIKLIFEKIENAGCVFASCSPEELSTVNEGATK